MLDVGCSMLYVGCFGCLLRYSRSSSTASQGRARHIPPTRRHSAPRAWIGPASGPFPRARNTNHKTPPHANWARSHCDDKKLSSHSLPPRLTHFALCHLQCYPANPSLLQRNDFWSAVSTNRNPNSPNVAHPRTHETRTVTIYACIVGQP